MPASMTHLILAQKVCPAASPVFNIGTIAPDTVVDWHEKDIVHFRNLKDRLPALTALAKETTGDFAEGVLLHLWLDWQWDTTIREDYIQKVGADWFLLYRDELSHAGSHAYHNLKWAAVVWEAMTKVDVQCYGVTPSASPNELKAYLDGAYKWHCENILEPSKAFPPQHTEDFTTKAAKEYAEWRETVRIT